MLVHNTEIPLFPLNTVLFPGMMLPLHIFEERYKTMINQCISQRDVFGVVLARNKQAIAPSVGSLFTEDLFTVGTTAHITAVERLSDDRMNLITVGQDRFVIRNVRPSPEDYLIGTVDPYPLDEESHLYAVAVMSKRLRPLVQQYIEYLATASGEDLSDAKLPDDPRALAYLAGTAVQGPLADKQQLLSAQSLGQLVSKTVSMIDRENKIMAYMLKAHHTHQQIQRLPFVDFSLN